MTAVPSHADCLIALAARLMNDKELSMLCPTIMNTLPQDCALPAMRFRWEQASEWDTKDSAGHDGFATIDIWQSIKRGDLESLKIADRVIALLHENTLERLTTGQSLILRHDYMDTFIEPDGLTHHTTLRFRHVITN